MPDVIFKMRLTQANLDALERGIEVETVRFAEGVDGIYQLYITGHGPVPIPDSSDTPAVQLKDK